MFILLILILLSGCDEFIKKILNAYGDHPISNKDKDTFIL